MKRKRLVGLIFLIVVGGMGWYSYSVLHQSQLDQALLQASSQGDPEPVRRLLDQGADPNARGNAASELPWQHFLNLLFRRPSVDTPIYPLSQALASNHVDPKHLEIARLLLEHHANPNVTMLTGVSAIRHVCEIDSADQLLTLLLKHGANPNTVDRTGSSLLMCEQRPGQAASTQALLENGADPNLANADGDTPLMWAACRGEEEAVALLLSHGADINHKNRQGQTALMYTLISSYSRETLPFLLNAGANVNAADNQGWSSFLYALRTNPQIAEAMLAKGGEVHKAISVSAATPNINLRMHMQRENASENSSISFPVVSGTTSLMLAVATGDVALVKGILAKGADVKARNAKGQTALTYVDPSSEITALLKHAGARP